MRQSPYALFGFALFLTVPFVLFPMACGKNLTSPNATPTPTPANTPTSTPTNSLSAFATLGSGAYFNSVRGIQYENGSLWVVNLNFAGSNLQEWVTNGGAPATTISTFNSGATFDIPFTDGIDPATGNVYLDDTGNGQIEVFDPTGVYLTTFGKTQLNGLESDGVAVNAAGTTVYASGGAANEVFVYSITAGSPPVYTYQFNFGTAGFGPVTLYRPEGLRVDGGGDVWVADEDNHRVAEYSGSGAYFGRSFTVSGLPNPFNPSDLVLDGSGDVYAADIGNNFIVEFNSSGAQIGQFGQGILDGPAGITTDGSGNFYVSDPGHSRIVVFH